MNTEDKKMIKKDKITFGTAGWRGIISDDFTFKNLRAASQAISGYLLSTEDEPKVVVGYDTRFLSEEFSKAASEVLAGNGIKVIYSESDVPTPVISHYIIENALSGGINITASHNPPEYSGIKFSPSWGGPALPEATREIEKRALAVQEKPETLKRMDFDEAVSRGLIEIKNISASYIKVLKKTIDIESIEKSISIAFDCMYGTARNYIPEIIGKARLKIINGRRDVLFGGNSPEPAEKLLSGLKKTVKDEGYDIGLACDGDGDRFGVIDSDGTFISPNQVLGLALHHLYKKGFRGVAVRSVMTSSFIDGVAEKYSVDVIQTPVGFKYIGDVFVKRDMIVGGEESGGLTIGGHLPEKDGILACLLMAELRASSGKTLKDILDELQKETGTYVTVRKNYRLKPDEMEKLRGNLKKTPPDSFGSVKVDEVLTLDGYKFILGEKNSWLGLRFSGTEPVVRLYAESTTREKADGIIQNAEKRFKLKA